MVDPQTAVFAAANVAQFIDFVIKVVRKSQEIRQLANGMLEDYTDLSVVTKDLTTLTQNLRGPITISHAANHLVTDQLAFRDI